MVVKYRLLHKPTLSGWPSIPRQIKTIIFTVILITVLLLVIVQSSRNAKLRFLYMRKESTAEILDLEIQYMPLNYRSEISDEWKSASIKDGIIYSAYLDDRPEIVLEDRHRDDHDEKTWAVIKIIAILPLEMNDKPLTCYFKYRDLEDMVQPVIQNKTASRVKAMKENGDLIYSAFFVHCDLTLPVNMKYVDFYYDQHLPMEVALGSNSHEDLDRLQFIDIHYPQNGVTQTNNDEDEFLAVCGPVLRDDYDGALHLIEYIEYHLMVGVDHLTFYNESVTPEVSQVLSYYEDKNLATILNWELPTIYKYELTLRLGGLFAAMNDCLYRNSFYKNYRYVLVSDTDEFIIPKKNNDLKELLDILDPPRYSSGRNKHASFKFKNAYFYLMYHDDKTNLDPELPYLYLQAKTERVQNPDDVEGNGKYIVRSQDAVELGSHSVRKYRPGASAFTNGYDEYVVDEDIALSHHYRSCEADTVACYFKETIVDRSAHKYIKELGRRVANTCEAIFRDSGCKLTPTNKSN